MNPPVDDTSLNKRSVRKLATPDAANGEKPATIRAFLMAMLQTLLKTTAKSSKAISKVAICYEIGLSKTFEIAC